MYGVAHKGRRWWWWWGGFISITSAVQPKAILLPLFQLSSCHLQNIMHFGFFYANFFGGTIFPTIRTWASNRKSFMAWTPGCREPCQVKQWLLALSKHISALQCTIKFPAHCSPGRLVHKHTLNLVPGAAGQLIKILMNIDWDMHGNRLLNTKQREWVKPHISLRK